MLLQQLLVPTFLLFFSPVWATFAEVVAGTARLGILSAQGDDDISQIDSFSRVQDAQVWYPSLKPFPLLQNEQGLANPSRKSPTVSNRSVST